MLLADREEADELLATRDVAGADEEDRKIVEDDRAGVVDDRTGIVEDRTADVLVTRRVEGWMTGVVDRDTEADDDQTPQLYHSCCAYG